MQRWFWRLALTIAAAGCGRLGFDAPINGTDSDGDGVPDSIDLCAGDDTVDVDGNGVPDACAACAPGAPCEQLGVPDPFGIPSWSERVVMVALNAARSDPSGYRDRFMTFGDNTGALVFDSKPTPREPLYFAENAATAGRFHASDRVTCIPGPVDRFALCDGTPWTMWKAQYEPVSAIAVMPVSFTGDLEFPLQVVNGFICRTLTSSYLLFNCGDDASSSTRNSLVFNTTRHQVGIGAATAASLPNSFWTVLLVDPAPSASAPIASGGHMFHDGSILFTLNVSDAVPPRGAYVVIEGSVNRLPLILGSASLGTYALALPLDGTCRKFYFVVTDDAGRVWRYPGRGQLAAVGDGTCAADWAP